MTTAGQSLRRFFDLLTERQPDDAFRLFDRSGSFWSRPTGDVPMEAFIYIMQSVLRICPMTFEIRSEMEKGDRAIIEMQGRSRFLASGESYDNNYIFVADVQNGLIVYLREYSDSVYANDVFSRNLPADILRGFAEIVAKGHS